MPTDSPEALIQSLRASGLLTAEQLAAVVRDQPRFGRDVQALSRHLVQAGHLTAYQLRKVVYGKAADLFVGRYIISAKVGEGGMGKVYRARHAHTGREVALKVVRSKLLSNPVIRKRYEREAVTAAALQHPNIVALLDAGEGHGKYFLAMEFVDGVDLGRLVREFKPLRVAEACEYARQAALGLQHAHDRGFVHRDVKPSNVVVAGERHVPRATEPAVVKILDMGLVRSVGFDDGGDMRGDLTRAGTVVGTPDYMAPEQAKNSSTVDGRADIYSLGCTLYFMLTAQPPFPVGTPIEKLLKHQLDQPTPLRSLRRDVPDAVVAVVTRSMAKNPAQRFPSAGDLAAALAPLARHSVGPEPLRARHGVTPDAGGGIPPAGYAPLSPGGPTAYPVGAEPPMAEPVATSDYTPRPADMPAPLHAGEGSSPFASLSDPPSGSFPSGESVRPPATRQPAPPRAPSAVWWVVATVLVLLAAVALGLWLVFGDRGASPTQATQPAQPNEPKPARHGIVPVVNQARLHPPLSLVPDGVGLVVVAYPAAYFREKDSPFTKGAGSSRLYSWTSQFAADTALPLVRADRIVLSVPAANPDQFLLASEGDYLTPGFAGSLPGHAGFAVPKQAARLPDEVKLFSAGRSRFAALITPRVGHPVFGVSTNVPLVRNMAARLLGSGKATPVPDLDPGVSAAITAASDPPPLVLAAAGPQFRPFAGGQTLGEAGIELVTLRVRIGERMEFELTASGTDEAAVRKFVGDLPQHLRAAYPHGGSQLADLVTRAERGGQPAAGKYRLTLKGSWTAEQWSSFLDKLLP